jgi:hypothetical protein
MALKGALSFLAELSGTRSTSRSIGLWRVAQVTDLTYLCNETRQHRPENILRGIAESR